MIDRLLSLVAPHICCSCGTENAILCENCFFDIIDEPFSQCIECFRPTASSSLCMQCRHTIDVDDAWAVAVRKGVVKELIDLYKFDHAYEASLTIARLLDARLPQLPDGSVVCYIPDIPAHRRMRGFDHMKRIADEFGSRRELPVIPLIQRKTFLSQRGLSRQERKQRQVDAFTVSNAADIEHCLLLDDVYTTGATMRSAIGALRVAGIPHVYAGVVARQPLDDMADL